MTYGNIISLTVLSPYGTVLPNHVVSAETVNTFKQRLDKFWIDQDVMYNYKADFHGNNNNVVL